MEDIVDQSPQIDKILIFTDAATSPQAEIAIGAFLCLLQQDIDKYSEFSIENLTSKLMNSISYKEYKSKKSTWSEIKTVIDALTSIKEFGHKIEIYTDCQSLCDLIGPRKEKLEKRNFVTKTGKILQNADLYQELFAITKNFQIQIFKVKGHHPAAYRLTVQEKIFSILDKLSRKKLRLLLKCKTD